MQICPEIRVGNAAVESQPEQKEDIGVRMKEGTV